MKSRPKKNKSSQPKTDLQSSAVSVLPHVVSRTVENEELIVCLERGFYYGLNGTGSFIWRELQKQEMLTTVAEKFAAAYSLSPENAIRDVLKIVRQLKAKKLIEIVNS